MIHSTPVTVAAFDFDKTITNCDTLPLFLLFTSGPLKTLLKYLCLAPFFIGFILKIVSRQKVKEKVFTSFFKGKPEEIIRTQGKLFADTALDRYIKPEAIEKVRMHQNAGHRCILVSASPNLYLNPWADRYGFDRVLCTEPEVDSLGNFTGKIRGRNCWGPEKKNRLLDVLGPKSGFILYMYGDSRGDKELLELADYPFFKKFS